MKQKWFIPAAIAFQVGVLLVLVASKLFITGTGTEVYLRIEPVDPRDPLRGDFVTFRFQDISSVQLSYLEKEARYFYPDSQILLQYGQPIYVSLRKNGLVYVVDSVSFEKPKDGLFIKGTASQTITQDAPSRRAPMTYGIEEYYIPENSGRNVRFGDNAIAVVKIDANGNAVITSILVDGKKWP